MSQLLLQESAQPSTPASGKGAVFVDTYGILCYKDDAGRVWGSSRNAAVAAQGAGFASDTWVTNSDIQIPSFNLQTKTVICWQISASKTAASTGTPVYTIRTGANRSTADTSRLALTGPAQTAIADIGTLNIMVTVRSVGSGTSTVLQGTAFWTHRGTAANTTTSGTGFANDSTGHVEGTGSGFDYTSLPGQYISLSINGGASSAWTVTQVCARADW